MSAECTKHGTDIVYPPGSWPVGVCPSCERETFEAQRNQWIRAFNRVEAAISRHRKAKENTGFCDDADDALHAAHDKILKSLSAPSREDEQG